MFLIALFIVTEPLNIAIPRSTQCQVHPLPLSTLGRLLETWLGSAWLGSASGLGLQLFAHYPLNLKKKSFANFKNKYYATFSFLCPHVKHCTFKITLCCTLHKLYSMQYCTITQKTSTQRHLWQRYLPLPFISILPNFLGILKIKTRIKFIYFENVRFGTSFFHQT